MPAPRPSGSGADPVARVEDLCVTFRRRAEDIPAVRDVALDIRPGEVIAVVGESGCGKTTFGLALTGLLLDEPHPPRVTGTIEVLGTDLLQSSERERQRLRRSRVSAVFQDPMTSLNPTMRIGRQIGEVSGSDAESIRLLESVGVMGAERRLRSYPHELSGGQRQRVMIAIAIAREPELVIADEPTTALDVTIQAQLLSLIARLRDETRTTFVFVTHDLGVAAQLADRIAVFYAGRVVELGPAETLLATPSHPYTMALLSSRITLQADRSRPLQALGGEAPRPQALPGGCAFAPRCPHALPRCLEKRPDLLPVSGRDVSAACLRAEELKLAEEASNLASAWPAGDCDGSNGVIVRLEGVEKEFRVRGRSARRQRLRALRAVDLEVGAGECVGIVGESGCGKSTLLRVVGGLTDPDAGSVSAPTGEIQMVFQDAAASMTPWLSVGEQIAERLPREIGRRSRRAAVIEALRSVGLPEDVIGAKPRQLSGGQRQRAALARAIVVPPKVLLADEPTSSLDVSFAATILNLIGTLRRKLDMSVMFVSHDLAAARMIADRIAVMYLGRIVEVGPADELAANPGHPYTKALIAAVPDIGMVKPEAKGELPDPLHPPSGCPYHPRCLEAEAICADEDPPMTSFGGGGTRQAACIHVGR